MDLQSVTFDSEEVAELSMDLLASLDDSGVELSLGTAALALSLGRIMAQRRLTTKEQLKFVQDLLEWSGMYFAEGGTN